MPRYRLIPAATLLALALTGCSTVYVPSFIRVYQPDIEQGNVLEPGQVAKLHVGMTRSAVHRLLGTPALSDIFHRDTRETYVFYDKPGKHDVFEHTLVLKYTPDGTVAKIEQSGQPLYKAPAKDFPESVLKKKPAKEKKPAPAPEKKSPYRLTPPKPTPPGSNAPGSIGPSSIGPGASTSDGASS